METIAPETTFSFLQGGGEMGELTRNYNWSQTSIGGPERWPQSLRTTLSILLNSKFPMFLWWTEDLIQFYNDAYRPSLGEHGKHPTALGQKGEDCWPEIWPVIKPLIDQVLIGGEATWSEDQLIPIYRNDKLEDVYWTFGYSPVNDESGKPAGVLVICTETTKTVLARQRTLQDEQNLRNIILQAPVAMCILRGPQHVVEIANGRMFELWGKQKEDILNKPIFEGLPEARSQGYEELLENVYTTGKTFTAYGLPVTLPRNNSIETFYINFVYEAFRESDGHISAVMVVAADVTEQVVASKKIENSEARFRLMADAMPQFVWTSDVQGNLNYYNQAVYDYTGLSFKEIRKDGWLQIVHPDDREENIKLWMHAMETGDDFIFQHRFKNKAGGYRWQLSRAVAQRDSSGNIQLWIGTSTDIHEQKLFEEELNKQVKERTGELEAKNNELKLINSELEQFTYAASHDMQEPLRKVHTFSSFLLENNAAQLDERGKSYLQKIGASVHRMKIMIDGLLNYSIQTKEEQAFESVDLAKTVANVEADLELIIEQKEAVICKDVLPRISGVPTQMNQLFFNLFSNALKFSRPGIPVRIDIKCEAVSSADAATIKGLDPRRSYFKITFSDNGIGFDQQHAEQIFSLFKRLHGKSEYEGTGIGLGLCKKIVQNHQGEIWAASEPGQGARFYIVLPENGAA